MVKTERIYILFETVFVVLVLIAGVEYFKYSTRINYDWFHCTPQVSVVSNSIKKVIAVGGPSCDKRGQLKSITKRLSREFEPNEESVISCIKEDGDIIVGYGANSEDEAKLKSLCDNVIHW